MKCPAYYGRESEKHKKMTSNLLFIQALPYTSHYSKSLMSLLSTKKVQTLTVTHNIYRMQKDFPQGD